MLLEGIIEVQEAGEVLGIGNECRPNYWCILSALSAMKDAH